MEELIQRISSEVGIDPALARKAVEIIINFLHRDGPQPMVGELIGKFPGAEALVRDHGEGAPKGFFGGKLGSLFGGGMGAMAALNELTDAGLELDQVQQVTRLVVDFAKEHAGEEVVDQVVSQIPGLSQFV
jgi:hypothetical protein